MEKQVRVILDAYNQDVLEAKIMGWERPTIRATVQSFGYDLANDYGFLEMYIDSWGLRMNRAEDAFDNNWGHLFVGE